MSRAGYCVECQANVWLLEGGRCQHGHSAASVTSTYEAGASSLAASDRASGSTQTFVIIVAITLVTMLILSVAFTSAIAVGGIILASQMPQQPVEAASVPDDLHGRVSRDYPEWRVVGSNAASYSEFGRDWTDYTFTVVPPGRDYSLGVVYISRATGRPVIQDEILRPGGRLHDWSGPLFEYLQREYADAGKDMVAVESDSEGSVTVSWTKDTKVGELWHHTEEIDGLWYDTESMRWKNAADPGL